MKKLMLLAAMLAMVLVAASPAFAQDVETETNIEDIEVNTQDVSQGVEGATDSIVQNCPATITFGDEFSVDQTVSGDAQNAVITVDGDENEVEIEQELVQAGFSPEVATECEQAVEQAAAAAAGGGEAKAEAGETKAEAKAGEAKAQAGGAQAQAGGGQGGGGAEAQAGGGAEAQAGGGAEAQAGGGAEAKASGGGGGKAQLPATGGASLFALGAGALLVTGGLVARRIIK